MVINLKLNSDDKEIIDKEMMEQMKASARHVARSIIDEEIKKEILRIVKDQTEYTVKSKINGMLRNGIFDHELQKMVGTCFTAEDMKESIAGRVDYLMASDKRYVGIIETIIKEKIGKALQEAISSVR